MLLAFLVTGLVSASWAARIPAIQEQLGLVPSQLGVAVLALEAGAVAGLPLGGRLAARFGARAALRAGFTAYAPALALAGLAPSLGALTAALALMAAGNSVVDVALNAGGAELERRAGRPLLAGMHAGHGFGVLAGALGGAAAAAAGLAPAPHFALVATVALPVTLVAARAAPQAGKVGRDHPRLRGTAVLGAVAFCAFLRDGAAYTWIAVHLREGGAGAAHAAAGVAAFAAALAGGRLVSDRLVARHGRRAVVAGGAILTAAGAVLALAAPQPAFILAGWALYGLG